MECINCTQCIDACDDVMERVGSPKGLIRYSSQDSIAGKAKKVFRARTIVYPVILLALFSGLIFAISTKAGFDARIIRHSGAPFTAFPDGTVSNEFRIRLVNRTNEPRNYQIAAAPESDYQVEVLDESKMKLDAGESALVPVHMTFKGSLTRGSGRKEVQAVITDDGDNTRTVEFFLLGPR